MKDVYTTQQVKQEEPYEQQVLQPQSTNLDFQNHYQNQTKQEVKHEVKHEVKSKQIYKQKKGRMNTHRRGGKYKSTKNGLDKNLFFKTRICPFLLSGHCSKRDRCTYAHSQKELRDPPNLKKTKLCQQFLLGRCQMGVRCSYAHGEHELRSMDMYKYKPENSFKENFDENLNDPAGSFKFQEMLTGNQTIGYFFNPVSTLNPNFVQPTPAVKQENPVPPIVQNQQFMQNNPMMHRQTPVQGNGMMQFQNPVQSVQNPQQMYQNGNFNQNFQNPQTQQFGLPGQIAPPQVVQNPISFNPDQFSQPVRLHKFDGNMMNINTNVNVLNE